MKIKTGSILAVLFLLTWTVPGFALDIVLEPDNAQREIGGKVRVHFYADNAVNLISMGIKVSFDASILQVESASKYEVDADTGWVMDADDGDPAHIYRTPDVEIDNTNGVVTMIGGNLKGETTTGLSGKVLLGWIVFEAVLNGNSPISIDLAKYHPNDPTDTFDNFVKLGGAVDEPGNVPGDLGIICVKVGAHPGDINANNFIDPGDYAVLRAAMGKAFPDPDYNVLADLNANGFIDPGDYAILRAHMGKPCLSCP